MRMKQEYETKTFINSEGYLVIRQQSLEFGKEVDIQLTKYQLEEIREYWFHDSSFDEIWNRGIDTEWTPDD